VTVASSNVGTSTPWRLAIVHETRFDYDGPTLTSYNEARLTPLTTARQSVTDATLEISPRPGVVHRYWDYWGTLVSAFDLSEPHTVLEVVSRSTVETNEALAAPDSVDWAELTSSARTDTYAELLAATPRTLVDADTVAALAEGARDVSPAVAARAIADRVRENVEYVPGSTEVQTGAQEAWNQRAGVCQDIAHLTIGVLRAVGVPARYVSGYLHPDKDAPIGQESSGQSHAWVEWWTGAWWGYDPTNLVPAGHGHVIVGRGRDYTDVPPLKGVYSGPPSTHVDVGVKVTRLS
jgi:transglutaminase-like putative cysteine protease